MIPMLNLDERRRIVCTRDPAVDLPAGMDRTRSRWIACPGQGEKEEATVVRAEALVVTVRPLSSDEQWQVMPDGTASLDERGMARAALRAPLIAAVGISCPTKGIDAHVPKEVGEALRRMPLPYMAGIGNYILDRSVVPPDPFDESASASSPTPTPSTT